MSAGAVLEADFTTLLRHPNRRMQASARAWLESYRSARQAGRSELAALRLAGGAWRTTTAQHEAARAG